MKIYQFLIFIFVSFSGFSQEQLTNIKGDFSGGSFPYFLGEYEGKAIFHALSNSESQIWETDGTTLGTKSLFKLDDESEESELVYQYNSGLEGRLSLIKGDTLFMIVRNSQLEHFLLTYDLKQKVSSLLPVENAVRDMFVLNENLYLIALNLEVGTFLFRLQNEELLKIDFDNGGKSSFRLFGSYDDDILISNYGFLLSFDGSTLKETDLIVPNEEFNVVSTDSAVYVILSDRILVLSSSEGVFREFKSFENGWSVEQTFLSEGNLVIFFSKSLNLGTQFKVEKVSLLNPEDNESITTEVFSAKLRGFSPFSNIQELAGKYYAVVDCESEVQTTDYKLLEFDFNSNESHTTKIDTFLPEYYDYYKYKLVTYKNYLLFEKYNPESDWSTYKELKWYNSETGELGQLDLFGHKGIMYEIEDKFLLGASKVASDDFELHSLELIGGQFKTSLVVDINKNRENRFTGSSFENGYLFSKINGELNSRYLYKIDSNEVITEFDISATEMYYNYLIEYNPGEPIHELAKPRMIFSNHDFDLVSTGNQKVYLVDSEGSRLLGSVPWRFYENNIVFGENSLVIKMLEDSQEVYRVFDFENKELINLDIELSAKDYRQIFSLGDAFYFKRNDNLPDYLLKVGVFDLKEITHQNNIFQSSKTLWYVDSNVLYQINSNNNFIPVAKELGNYESIALHIERNDSSLFLEINYLGNSSIVLINGEQFIEGFDEINLFKGENESFFLSGGDIYSLNPLNSEKRRIAILDGKDYIIKDFSQKDNLTYFLLQDSGVNGEPFSVLSYNSLNDSVDVRKLPIRYYAFHQIYLYENLVISLNNYEQNNQEFIDLNSDLSHVFSLAYGDKILTYQIKGAVNGKLYYLNDNSFYEGDFANGGKKILAKVNEVFEWGDSFYMSAYNSNFGYEPYVFSKVTGELRNISDIYNGVMSSFPHNFFGINKTVYCFAKSKESDFQLWRLNGSNVNDDEEEAPLASLEESFELNIAPNPAVNILSYELFSNSEFLNFQIYDLCGRLYLEGKGEKGEIDISSLNLGNYLLRIQTEDNYFVKRFVKI